MPWSIGVIIFFYVLFFGLGYVASRKAKDAEASSDGLLLAGRNMPVWIGVLTMTATWVGGGYINGTAETVYQNGLVWAQAPWGYSISLIIGGLFFASIMRKRAYTTMLDPFEQRYGKNVSSMLFLPALVGEIFWCAAILTALGVTFATILQTDTTVAIVVSAAVVIAYTMMGGLWSVAYTDVIQILFIGAGLTLAIPFAVSSNGGWEVISTAYQNAFGADAQFLPDWKVAFSGSNGGGGWPDQIWYWLDMALLLMLGGIPWGVYFQRVLSAPSPRAARNLSFVAGILCFAMAIPAIMMGMVGKSVDWMALTGSTPEAAMILPYVLQYATPGWVGVLGMSVIAAAVMSSVDSSILSASTMFTWNIVRPWTNGKLDGRQLALVTKLGIVVFGSLATLLALSANSVYALWYLCGDLVYVLLFPQLVLVLFYRKAHKAGAVWGFVVGLILRIGGGEPSLGLPAILPYPMIDDQGACMFPFRTVAMLCSMITVYLVSEWQTSTERRMVRAKSFDGLRPAPAES